MKAIIKNMSEGNEVLFSCLKQTNENILTEKDIENAWERTGLYK